MDTKTRRANHKHKINPLNLERDMMKNTKTIFATFALSASLLAATSVNAASLIVGSWLLDAGGTSIVTSFLSDGRYMEASVFAGDSAHTGIEWGTYSWNSTTGAITATSTVDTNGNWGISGDVDGTQYLTISGDTGTIFQPSCGPSCTGTVSRIPPSAVVPVPSAAWLLGSGLLGLIGVARRKAV